MALLENGFAIRIRNVTSEMFVSQTEPRSAFWEPRTSSYNDLPVSLAQAQKPPIESIHYWEEKVRKEFGYRLKDIMLDRIEERELAPLRWLPFSTPPELISTYRRLFNRHAELSYVEFEVRNISYSSMTLGVAIAGVESLVRAFDANYDLFRIFLEGFIHPAFAAVVGQTFAEQMQYEIIPSPQLIAEFSSQPTTMASAPSSPAGPETSASFGRLPAQVGEKARFAWGLVNTSLLVPVVFALLVCYLAFQEMNVARTQYNTAVQSLLEHQAGLLEEDRNRLNGYNAIQDAMIRERLQLGTAVPPTISPTSIAPTATPAG